MCSGSGDNYMLTHNMKGFTLSEAKRSQSLCPGGLGRPHQLSEGCGMSPGRGIFFSLRLWWSQKNPYLVSSSCAHRPWCQDYSGVRELNVVGGSQEVYLGCILKNDNTVCLKFRLNWASSIYLATLPRDKASECCPLHRALWRDGPGSPAAEVPKFLLWPPVPPLL